MNFSLLADLVLLVCFSARLLRLVIVDDLGQMLVQEPVGRVQERAIARGDYTRARLLNMTLCPWCIGFWLCALTLASLLVALGVGGLLHLVWRCVAGLFSLNYVAAHLMGRLGDFDEPEEQ